MKGSVKIAKEVHSDLVLEITITSTILTISNFQDIRKAIVASLDPLVQEYDMDMTELGDSRKRIFGDLLLSRENFTLEYNLRDISGDTVKEAS